MGILLFLDFHFGDQYGVANAIWDWVKIMIPVIVAFSVIFLQRGLDKKKRHKEQELKLYNFNQYIARFNAVSQVAVNSIKKSADQMAASPFQERPIDDRYSMPQLDVILGINKDDIFTAFISKYNDKKEAALAYQHAYDMVHMFKYTYDDLYLKYEKTLRRNNTSFMDIRELLFKINIELLKAHAAFKENFSHDFQNRDPVKDLKAYEAEVHKTLSGISEADLTMQISYTTIIPPLILILNKHVRDYPLLMELTVLANKTQKLFREIGEDTNHFSNYIKYKVSTLNGCLSELRKINKEVDKKLPKYKSASSAK